LAVAALEYGNVLVWRNPDPVMRRKIHLTPQRFLPAQPKPVGARWANSTMPAVIELAENQTE